MHHLSGKERRHLVASVLTGLLAGNDRVSTSKELVRVAFDITDFLVREDAQRYPEKAPEPRPFV